MQDKLRDKIAYKFDNIMSRGLISLIGLLAIGTLLVISLVSALVGIFRLFPPGEALDFFEVLWASLLRTLDPGTMGQDQGFGFRAAMLLVTVSGIVVVASLIGIISNAFNSKVEQLRKGRSRVLEQDHTLILGWNSKVFNIIHEISIANESRKKPAIVILADLDKVQMEDEIRAKVGNTLGTRIIVRSGDPMNLTDMQIVAPHTARSIVILSPDDNPDADSISIKTCLALTNQQVRKNQEYHIVGEIKDLKNLEAAALVGGKEAHWVQGDDLICRIIVQTCRQSGLSAVFTELLDFEGSELYIREFEGLNGLTYGDALLKFETGCVIGLIRDGVPFLNPATSFSIEPGDSLVVVAEDDSHITVSDEAVVDEKKILRTAIKPAGKEKTLILGCNSSLGEILREMAGYMTPGSLVQVVAEEDVSHIASNGPLKILISQDDPTDREVLERIEVENFDHIIVLASRKGSSMQHSDARTLLTLLHLRDIAKSRNAKVNIVSEMLDDRNRALAEATNADDFIVSDKLVSLMIAQLEESPELAHVFTSLLSSEGSEIKLQPISNYVELATPVSFNTLVAAARDRGESAFGFSIAEHRESDERLFGLQLGPERSTLRNFAQGDLLAVLTNN